MFPFGSFSRENLLICDLNREVEIQCRDPAQRVRRYSAEAIASRREVAALIRAMRALAATEKAS
jgi:hypothetical protein